MAYANTYTILWNHQTRLFTEIEILRSQISHTERSLQRAQQLLASEGLKRNERRKANWTVTSNRRHMRDLDKELQALMQALLVCQAQLARMHTEASQGVFEPYGLQAGGQGYGQPQAWDMGYPQRPLSTDSGFWEPALYAQPFDLNLSQADGAHLFSHELLAPFPVEGTHTAASALNPMVADFMPSTVERGHGGGQRSAVGSATVSPMSRTPASEAKKRYSEAAISLIEGRLRKRKRFQEGRAPGKQKETADVDVEVAIESAKRKRESNEVGGLVWPYSA